MDNDELIRKRRREIIISGGVLCTLAAAAAALRTIPREPVDFEANNHLREVLLHCMFEGTESNCFNLLRMNKTSFQELVSMLISKGLLHETQNVTVRSQWLIFCISWHIIRNFVMLGEHI